MDEEEKMDYIEEKPSKKNTMKARTKRYLAGFLILMIVCTVISRVTASVTTPRVSTTTPRRGSLMFKVEGTGVIEDSGEVFYPVQGGMKIDQIMVKAGDCVKEGQELFSYDEKALKEKIKEAEEAVKASQNTYDKQVLNDAMKEDDSVAAADKLKTAQEAYDDALDKLEEIKDEYDSKVKKLKDKLSKDKQDEYDTAKEAVDTAQDGYDTQNETYRKSYDSKEKAVDTAKKTQEEKITAANEELADAKESLNEITEKRDHLEAFIKDMVHYGKVKEYDKFSEVKIQAYQEYFGKDDYKTMMKSLKSAQKTLLLAQQDYDKLSKKWQQTLMKKETKMNSYDFVSQFEEYQQAYEDYQDQIQLRDEALIEAQRTIDTANENLNVNEKYTSLEQVTATFWEEASSMASGYTDNTYQAMHDEFIDETVMDQKKYDKALALVTKKETALEDTTKEQKELVKEAKDEVTECKKEWDETLAKEEIKIQKAKKKLEELLTKDYTGEDDIKTAWDTVETQQDTVKSAKNTLDDAKEAYDLTISNQPIQDKIKKIDLDALQKDIDDKQEALDELKKLKKNSAVVKSTIAGIISNYDVTQNLQTTGSEKVSIMPSSCVFTGTFSKEDRKHVEEGATLSCNLDTLDKAVDAEIVSIRFDQVNANYVFTASLPEGDYLPKTGGRYSITQQSSKYDTVIPYSALRTETTNKYYVLYMDETETVLGKESVAYRMDVELLAKDSDSAAVDGVYGDMRIITGSSRNIVEGDRVREGEYE